MSLTAHTTSSNQTPLQMAFQTLLAAPSFTTPDQIREMILGTDLIVASFGLGLNDRDTVTCPDEELTGELIITATPLAKVHVSMAADLLDEIEELLARHAPKAFIAYACKRRLWNDAAAWNRNIGRLAAHVTDPEVRKKLIAVLADHLFPEAIAA